MERYSDLSRAELPTVALQVSKIGFPYSKCQEQCWAVPILEHDNSRRRRETETCCPRVAGECTKLNRFLESWFSTLFRWTTTFSRNLCHGSRRGGSQEIPDSTEGR